MAKAAVVVGKNKKKSIKKKPVAKTPSKFISQAVSLKNYPKYSHFHMLNI